MIPRASAWSSGKKLVPNISTFPCYKVHFRRRPTITPEIKEGGTVESISRRKLLRSGSQAIAGGACMGVLPMNAAASASASPATSVDYYQKLGVTPFINAAGTYTILSASILPDQVQAAIALAAQKPVHLMELHKAAGEYLARRLRCEGALVTSGAAAAIKLATAACITRGNKNAVVSIPTEMQGLKNEVIVQKAHHYDYDHAIRDCGARFVDVETLDECERAFTERTVMTQFFNAAEGGHISREKWIEVAHRHGVPCFNDAAADVPPISNLWNYTQMGFDLVTFSGGKGLRGPQNAGLLLGRKDLIEAAAWSNSPHDETVGRGMKVAKEQIIGMVAAVDWYLSQTDDGMQAEFRHRAERIAAVLKDVPTLTYEIVVPPLA